MADVTDGFGRVSNFDKADFESIADMLRTAVGKAVDYASGKAKESSDATGKAFDELVKAMEELGDNVKDSLNSTKEFVDKVKKASESLEARRRSGGGAQRDSMAAAQREQTRILNLILKNQQRAIAEKAAKFTTGGTTLSSGSARRPALKEMGFRPRGADRVPAMLSPGEFVVSRKGTRGNEGTLNRINRGYMRGGKVKPAYLEAGGGLWDTVKGLMRGKGGISYDAYEGKTRVLLDPGTDPETIEKIKKAFAEAGVEASTEFAENYKKNLGRTISGWTGGIAEQLIGHNPLQTLFEGSVKDVTEFRREMRNLAFQTEGITGDFREAQAEFSKIGTGIAARTGKSVTAFQKAYMTNARKGYKDQKVAMKTMESGLKLSTLIGSEAQSTATLFADWHRELGLGATQMDRMANNMQMVARSTGVTGDELTSVMKSSEGILKNLRRQGELTSGASKNIIQVMAELKKEGFDDVGQKVLGAMSGFSSFNSADDKTKMFVLEAAKRGGVNTRDAMFGRATDAESMGKMAEGMRDMVVKGLRGVDGFDEKNFDMGKLNELTEKQRDRLKIVAEARGMQPEEIAKLYGSFKKAGEGLAGTLADLTKAKNNRFSTDKERAEEESKRNDVLLSAAMDQLQSVSQNVESRSLSEAAAFLNDKTKVAGKDFMSGTKDLVAMSSDFSSSLRSQFGLSDNQKTAEEQIKGMDAGRQMQLRSMLAAEQLDKTMKARGKDPKNFAGQMQQALARGDTARFRALTEEMTAANSELKTAQAKNVDPMEKLNQTMTELNETLRGYLSPLVGGIIDLIGSTGLLAIAFGMMSGNLFNLFSPKFIQGIFGGGLGTKMLGGFDKFANKAAASPKDGMFQRFFKTYSKQRAPGVTAGGFKFREGQGFWKSFGRATKDMGRDVMRNLKGLGKSTSLFFSRFTGSFMKHLGRGKGLFSSMGRAFKTAMKSSPFTGKMLSNMASGLKLVKGRMFGIFSNFRRSQPAIAKFLINSAQLGKSFTSFKNFGQILPRFSRAVSSGFGIFQSVFKGGFSGMFKGAKGLMRGGFAGVKAALVGSTLGTAQIIFSAIDMVFGSVSGFMNTGKRFEGVMKAMGKSTKDMTWGMYASSTIAGGLVGILDGLTFGLLSMTGATEWLNQTLSLVFYTIFSVVEGIIEGIMGPLRMVWSAIQYIGTQFKSIGDSLLGVFNSIAGIFGSEAGNWSEAFAMLYPWLKKIGMIIGIIVGGPLAATLWALVKGISLALVPIQMFINAIAGIIKIFAGVIQFFKDIFTVGIGQAFKNLGTTVFNAIYGVFKPIVDFFGSLVKDIMAPFKWLYNILVGNSIIPDLCTGIVKFFGRMALNVLKFVAGIPGRVAKSLFNVFFKAPVKIFGKIFKHLNTKTISNGLGLVAQKFSGFFGLFRNNISGFTKFFATSWFDFMNKASGGLFGKVVDAVKNSKILGIVNDYLIGPISKGLSWLGEQAGQTFTWLGKRAKDIFSNAIGWVRGRAAALFPGSAAAGAGGAGAAGTGVKSAASAADDVATAATKAGAKAAAGAADDAAAAATKAAAGAASKTSSKTVSAAASSVDDLAKSAPKALGFLGKSSGLIKGMARKLPVVGPMLDFGIRTMSGESLGKATAGTAAGTAGGLGGAAMGAAIGTLIFPGVGTAIGGLLGGVLGGVGAGMASDAVYDRVVGTGSGGGVNKAAEKAAEKVEAKSVAAATPVGQPTVPAVKSEGTPAAGAQPVHLRDITGSILRDKAGAGGNKLQSDELARMESASQKQVSELEQIRQGIQELVSLMKPSGSNVAGDSGDMGYAKTKDPRRPMHAIRFGKMKYGKVGGLANRSFVNNGEV